MLKIGMLFNLEQGCPKLFLRKWATTIIVSCFAHRMCENRNKRCIEFFNYFVIFVVHIHIYTHIFYKIFSRLDLDTPDLERTEYFIDRLKRKTDLSDVLKIDTQMEMFRISNI